MKKLFAFYLICILIVLGLNWGTTYYSSKHDWAYWAAYGFNIIAISLISIFTLKAANKARYISNFNNGRGKLAMGWALITLIFAFVSALYPLPYSKLVFFILIAITYFSILRSVNLNQFFYWAWIVITACAIASLIYLQYSINQHTWSIGKFINIIIPNFTDLKWRTISQGIVLVSFVASLFVLWPIASKLNNIRVDIDPLNTRNNLK